MKAAETLAGRWVEAAILLVVVHSALLYNFGIDSVLVFAVAAFLLVLSVGIPASAAHSKWFSGACAIQMLTRLAMEIMHASQTVSFVCVMVVGVAATVITIVVNAPESERRLTLLTCGCLATTVMSPMLVHTRSV